ncbi:MAG: enoyl-CoA hydratase, partial [Boseongicola sp. SB0667_bin_21]|nr:enoyl-CoA hydratase [Boseongicola sp. SB0667_bin_21]
MEEFGAISVEVDERGVADLRLNNPERRNALSAQMMDELAAFARLARDRNDIRVVVLSGAGGTFCAGADLTWMKAQINANRETRIAEARRLAMMLK